MTEKSWLEVEMEESVTLLRKRLEEINDTHKDEVDEETVREIKDIYKSLYYIFSIKKSVQLVKLNLALG